MLPILIIIFILVPIMEIAVLLEVGQRIGTVYTILLVVVTGVVGAYLAKMEGLRVWYELQKDLQQFKIPTNRIIDGVLILIGGVLLLTPGLITDVLGLLLVLPFTRVFARKILKKKFTQKAKIISIK